MEVNRNVLFPNLITIGNGICGFAALALIAKAKWEPEVAALDSGQLAIFATASWLVLLGMVFDVFDGKVARLVGGGSPFGAMLD